MYYLRPSSQWFPQSNAKANGVRLNKLDKDRIFILRWNPRRVSKTIYSTESDSLSNENAVLRSTHDHTNSPNAAPRSTHDLHQTATNALGISTRSHDKPGMLWYHLLHARQQPMRNLPNRDRRSRRCTHMTRTEKPREKANQHSI